MGRGSFYFLRHGETDHNANGLLTAADEDPLLNELGRLQADAIAPLVKGLEIDVICHSPLQRVVETMALCSMNLAVPRKSIDHLKECQSEVWQKMVAMKEGQEAPAEVQNFFDQVQQGIREALSHGKSVLVIAHGGVHWALCYLLQVEDHNWFLENCGLVQFSLKRDGLWKGCLLNPDHGVETQERAINHKERMLFDHKPQLGSSA